MMLLTLVFSLIASIGLAFYTFKNSGMPILKIAILFYFANYILGHVILLSYRLIFRPVDYNLLADIRLQDINLDLKYLILLNILQLLFVCLGILLLRTKNSRNFVWRQEIYPEELNSALLLVTLIGWIGNIAALTGNNNLVSAFHPFELLGTAWLVSGFRLKPLRFPIVILLAVVHFIWAAFYYHSKSETFLIFVALLVRILHSETKIKNSQIWFVLISTFLLFPIVQIQKGIFTISNVQNRLSSQGQSFSFLKSTTIGYLQRFDGADSITDAFTAGPGSWYTLVEYTRIIILKFIPNISFLLGDYFGENTADSLSLGQLWNNQMRPFTIRNVTSGVPVSFGPMAEGYAIIGIWLGIVMCILFGASIKLFSYACYSKKLFPSVCGLYFLFHLENLQNSFGNIVLMLPKAVQSYFLIKICLLLVTPLKNRSVTKSAHKIGEL